MRILSVFLFVCVAGCSLSFGQTGDQKDALFILKVEGQKKEIILIVPKGQENPLKDSSEGISEIKVIKDEAGLEPFVEKYGDEAKAGVVVITLKKSMDNVPQYIKDQFGT